MKRRTAAQWKALTPAYRARLEKRGVTRQSYLRGDSLAGARGHAGTPERPERAAKQPDKFADYTRRQVLRGKKIKVASTVGVVSVAKMTKAHRSLVGAHWNVVGNMLDPFHTHRNLDGTLSRYRGRKVRGVDPATGQSVTYELETNETALVRLAQAGELDIEDIYDNQALSAAA